MGGQVSQLSSSGLMMTSWYINAFGNTGSLWGIPIGFPHELSAVRIFHDFFVVNLKTVEPTVDLPVIWDTMALMLRHCYVLSKTLWTPVSMQIVLLIEYCS